MPNKKRLIAAFGLFLVLTWVLSCSHKGVFCSKGTPEERQGYQGMILLGTNKDSRFRRELCSRDLDKILQASTLITDFQKDEVRGLICGPTSSIKGFYNFFKELAPEERADLIRSFEEYGYYIHGYG